MNRLKGLKLKLKFDVTDNPELSEAIQKRLFELGGRWADGCQNVQYTDNPWMYLGDRVCCWMTRASHGDADKEPGHCTLSTLDDLYKLPQNTTITFSDGKSVELSQESYASIRGLE